MKRIKYILLSCMALSIPLPGMEQAITEHSGSKRKRTIVPPKRYAAFINHDVLSISASDRPTAPTPTGPRQPNPGKPLPETTSFLAAGSSLFPAGASATVHHMPSVPASSATSLPSTPATPITPITPATSLPNTPTVITCLELLRHGSGSSTQEIEPQGNKKAKIEHRLNAPNQIQHNTSATASVSSSVITHQPLPIPATQAQQSASASASASTAASPFNPLPISAHQIPTQALYAAAKETVQTTNTDFVLKHTAQGLLKLAAHSNITMEKDKKAWTTSTAFPGIIFPPNLVIPDRPIATASASGPKNGFKCPLGPECVENHDSFDLNSETDRLRFIKHLKKHIDFLQAAQVPQNKYAAHYTDLLQASIRLFL